MPKLTPYLPALLLCSMACAQQAQTQHGCAPLSNISLTNYSFWQDKVERLNCTDDFDVPDERLIQIFDLTTERKLLHIACDYGAYQDSHRNYLIDTSGTILKSIIFRVPLNETPQKLHPSNTIWGNFSLTDNNELELLYLSAGSGACGYKATYGISNILNDAHVTPISVYADTDCYNASFVPSWPLIDVK